MDDPILEGRRLTGVRCPLWPGWAWPVGVALILVPWVIPAAVLLISLPFGKDEAVLSAITVACYLSVGAVAALFALYGYHPPMIIDFRYADGVLQYRLKADEPPHVWRADEVRAIDEARRLNRGIVGYLIRFSDGGRVLLTTDTVNADALVGALRRDRKRRKDGRP